MSSEETAFASSRTPKSFACSAYIQTFSNERSPLEQSMSCVYPPDVPIATLKQTGGNPEGGRMNQILSAARRCQVKEAIAKARLINTDSCCPPTPISRIDVPLESTALQGQLLACARITPQRAQILAQQPLRGVPESVRIARLNQQVLDQYSPYSDSNRRFLEYQGPQIPPVCPPLPTEITNANLPKPSTRCDTLALLATGVPPNSIARG